MGVSKNFCFFLLHFPKFFGKIRVNRNEKDQYVLGKFQRAVGWCETVPALYGTPLGAAI